MRCAAFLKKLGLDDELLGKIWDLSDPEGNGYLSRMGLFSAIKLVAGVQAGKEPNNQNFKCNLPSPKMGAGANTSPSSA